MGFFNIIKSTAGFAKLGHYMSQVYVTMDKIEAKINRGNYTNLKEELVEIAVFSKVKIIEPMEKYNYNMEQKIALDNLRDRVPLLIAFQQTIGRLITFSDLTNNSNEILDILEP